MSEWKRWRWWAVLALPVAVIVVNSFGPDGWHEPMVRLLWLSWSALCIAMAHSARKALFDYEDLKQVRDKAIQTPEGAGYWAIAIGIFVLAVSVIIHAVITVSTV